tara:strand:+ start:16711 stop:17139 length:429 start_codon:yes stop_codon:yes gene_type:complete
MQIECNFRSIPKTSFGKSGAPLKQGRYLSSVFKVSGYGESKWIVGCYLDIDYEPYLRKMSEQEFMQGCVEFLNQPPKRKRYEKRRKTPLYGTLELYDYTFRTSGEDRFVEIMLITDDPNNENFWGKGISYGVQKRSRRKRRA